MPDAPLLPRAALEGAAPRLDRIGGFEIAERADLALASLARRAGGADFEARAEALIGAPLPGPGQIAGAGPVRAFWIRPEGWMLAAPLASHADLAGHVAEAMGAAASVTDQTDGWACLTVSGADPAPLLERLCAIDPASLTPESALPTVIAHLECILLNDAAGLQCLTPRSSARSFHHALTGAARRLAARSTG